MQKYQARFKSRIVRKALAKSGGRPQLLALLLTIASSAHAKTLNLYLQDSPGSLDWNGLATHVEAPLLYLIEDGLYRYDEASGKLVPSLAESVDKSKDRRTYTFHLRKDAKWSDGVPIRAQDFIDSWLRLIAPQSTSLYNYYLYNVVKAQEFRQGDAPAKEVGLAAIDEHTLVVRLREPQGHWESITAFWGLFPIRKDILEKFGGNGWRPGIVPSSGPYSLESSQPGKKMVLKRNRYYIGWESNVDEIDLYFSTDFEDALRKYEAGFYSFLTPIPLSKIAALSARPDFRSQPVLRNYTLAVNAERYPMIHREFRAALFKSIDVETLQRKSGQQFTAARGFAPQSLARYGASLLPKFDPAGARESLRKSSVVLNSKLKVRILTRIQDPFAQIGQELRSQLERSLKINVELAAHHQADFNVYSALKDYDLALVSWSAKIPEVYDFLLPFSGFANNSRLIYKNGRFDQWLMRGILEDNETVRAQLLEQAEKLYLQTEYVVYPLLDEAVASLVSPKVREFHLSRTGILNLRKLLVE